MLPEEEEILSEDIFEHKLKVFPGSPACRPTQDFGLGILHNLMSQFLKQSLFVHPMGSISLENPDEYNSQHIFLSTEIFQWFSLHTKVSKTTQKTVVNKLHEFRFGHVYLGRCVCDPATLKSP